MSEEVPFKSMKITLSEEALEKLSELRQGGAFRSDSATIEECIRVTRDLITDAQADLGSYVKQHPNQGTPDAICRALVKTLLIRLSRFDKTVDSKIRRDSHE